MKDNRPDWERALSHSPIQKGGFSPELMKQIEQNAALATVKSSGSIVRWMSGISVVLGMMLLLLFITQKQDWIHFAVDNQGSSNTLKPVQHLTENMDEETNLFDPREIVVGDEVKGWKVTKVQDNYFDAPDGFSILTSFEGLAEVSGTFEYLDDDSVYNAGDIIFYLDEESSKKMPVPVDYGDLKNIRVILNIADQLAGFEDHMFVKPGTSGNATIIISEYHTLLAEAFGGVIDHVLVEKVVKYETTLTDKNIDTHLLLDIMYPDYPKPDDRGKNKILNRETDYTFIDEKYKEVQYGNTSGTTTSATFRTEIEPMGDGTYTILFMHKWIMLESGKEATSYWKYKVDGENVDLIESNFPES